MGILDSINTSPKEKAELGLPLPDRLSIFEICDLWCDIKNKNFSVYLKAICLAYEEGKLKGEFIENYHKPNFEEFMYSATYTLNAIKSGGFSDRIDYFNTLIHKIDFMHWLNSKGTKKPSGCLLAKWWEGSEPQAEETAKKTETSGINKRRDEAFKKWINAEKPDLQNMKVKEIIETLEAKNPGLFLTGTGDWWKNQQIHKGKPGRKKS
ncbi:MAG: hypothetical protein HOO92_15505 [Methylococcaceae bacterium]|nr:hypothetical protein [Methylococcaceae bacterium]